MMKLSTLKFPIVAKKRRGFYLVYFLLSSVIITPGISQGIYNHIPSTIDTTQKYLFYLHGRIIEDQGIRPKSDRFGIYEYEKILKTFSDKGFVVISEARKKNAQIRHYAQKVTSQIDSLIKAGVSPSQIIVVGASKGAAITVLISSLLKNKQTKFVIMAICNESMAAYWKKNDVHLWGKILYIYERSDRFAGSCKEYLKFLRSEGLTDYQEIELNTGLEHGFLFRPIKEWVNPVIQWANR